MAIFERVWIFFTQTLYHFTIETKYFITWPGDLKNALHVTTHFTIQSELHPEIPILMSITKGLVAPITTVNYHNELDYKLALCGLWEHTSTIWLIDSQMTSKRPIQDCNCYVSRPLHCNIHWVIKFLESKSETFLPVNLFIL